MKRNHTQPEHRQTHATQSLIHSQLAVQHAKFSKSLTLTMHVKRSRLGVIDKASWESEQSLSVPGILTVSSPEEVKKSGSGGGGGGGGGDHRGQIGNFLENCHFCKKRLRQQDDAFMCGSLHAFCTPLCRDKQIVFDKLVERVAKQPRGAGVECNGLRDVKDKLGFQVANCASLQ